MSTPSIYTVSEITQRIRRLLEDGIEAITVKGEISNLSQHSSSGHIYFSLKDAGALLRVTFFAGAQARMGPRLPQLANGKRVTVSGKITLYAPQGSYQLNAAIVAEAGEGDLMQRFEALKRKLWQEGLFAPERKRPLPLLPSRIGIVTSPTGAAIHDMLRVFARRYPTARIIIAPARVQGEGAAREIAEAIALLGTCHATEPLDAIIVGRGGGSIEDLWCFNEEIVARAIAASPVPTISAVGHEVDTTIADYAADIRAATPTAAAELIAGCKDAFTLTLSDAARRLTAALQSDLTAKRHTLSTHQSSALFRDPAHILHTKAQWLDGMAERLSATATLTLARRRHAFTTLENRFAAVRIKTLPHLTFALTDARRRIETALRHRLQRERQHLAALEGRLNDLSPRAVLSRGYTITRTAEGTLLRTPAQAPAGTRIETTFAEGTLTSTVE